MSYEDEILDFYNGILSGSPELLSITVRKNDFSNYYAYIKYKETIITEGRGSSAEFALINIHNKIMRSAENFFENKCKEIIEK